MYQHSEEKNDSESGLESLDSMNSAQLMNSVILDDADDEEKELCITERIRWFGTMDPAMDHMRACGNTIPIKKGNRLFGSVADHDELCELINESPIKDRLYLELMHDTHPRRMYADIEGENLGITKVELYTQFHELMQGVFTTIGWKWNPKKAFTLKSKGKKVSFHWCYHMVFATVADQKSFWQYVGTVIELNYPGLCLIKETKHTDTKTKVTTKYYEPGTIIDQSVYASNRAMRLIGCVKENSDRVLEPMTVKNGAFIPIAKGRYDMTNYFIWAINEDPDVDGVDIPTTPKRFSNKLTEATIVDLCKTLVPNTRWTGETRGQLFILRNEGTRTCIIGNEDNESDNCYVVWKKDDGLYFGCHDEACHASGMVKIYNIVKTVSTARFNYFCDYTKLFFGKKTLADVEECTDNTVSRIINGGKSFMLTRNRKEQKNRDYDFDYFMPVKTADLVGLDMATMIDLQDDDLATMQARKGPKAGKIITLKDIMVKHVILMNKLKSYSEVEYMPYLDVKPQTKNFNLFNPFKFLEAPRSRADFSKSRMYSHIRHELCCDQGAVFDYMLDWIAHIIQKPAELPGVAILFSSDQGIGKDMIGKFISQLIGMENAIIFESETDFFTNFNAEQQGKLFISMNEIADRGAAFNNHNPLKSAITKEKLRIEPKGMPAYSVNHFARYMFFTNNRNALRIENSDRRFCLIRCRGDGVLKKSDNEQIEYFKTVWGDVNDRDMMKSAFDFFRYRDISKTNIFRPPMTQYKSSVILSQQPSVVRFLLSQCADARDKDKVPKALKWTNTEFYTEYSLWCEAKTERSSRQEAASDHLKSLGVDDMKTIKIHKASCRGIYVVLNKFELQMQSYLKMPTFSLTRPKNVDDDECEDDECKDDDLNLMMSV